jgi:hypothetical protein
MGNNVNPNEGQRERRPGERTDEGRSSGQQEQGGKDRSGSQRQGNENPDRSGKNPQQHQDDGGRRSQPGQDSEVRPQEGQDGRRKDSDTDQR